MKPRLPFPLPRWTRPAAAIAGALLLAANAGALEWEAQTFESSARPLQATFDVTFRFRNQGPAPVTIQRIQTNCDCLSADTDRKIYQPGEEGTVTARFTVGDRLGLYERSIFVVSDDGPPQRLTVRIDVPEAASVEPSTLAWKLNAPADERSFEVRIADGLNIDFREAFPTNTDFRVRFEVLEANRHYRVHVAPAATNRAASAAIRVKGTASNGREVIVSAYVDVH